MCIVSVKMFILLAFISFIAFLQCGICLEEIRESSGANPVGCLDIFHEECLREWQKVISQIYISVLSSMRSIHYDI